MIVCIAEKPSVAKEIAKVLGNPKASKGYYTAGSKGEYAVTWAYGHLIEIKSPGEINESWKSWSMDILPMIPSSFPRKVMSDKGVKEQFRVIKQLFEDKNTTEIINCGDAGQEGELIQREIQELCRIKCPVKRLWISSLTTAAIKDGFRNLKNQSDYDNLYEASLARANGDWLLGLNATRLFTKKYSSYEGGVLSLGRVQTPTLAMIVERDNTIDHFKPEDYWLLKTRYRNVVFSSMKGQLKDKTEADTLLSKAKSSPFQVTKITKKQGSEMPGQLYDLTSLQVDCNKKFSLSAETTLNTIQSLYEKKVTTYPRVDTRFLPDDVYPTCPDILKNLTDYAKYTKDIDLAALKKSKNVFNSSKVTDHHAIIPTGEMTTLTDLERKVFDLIARRFISVFMEPCLYDTTTVEGKASDVFFKATGKHISSPGWKALYMNIKDDDDEENKKDDDDNQTLPLFKEGESGEHKAYLDAKKTTPPARYTEATLLQAMETAGKLCDNEELRDLMKENGLGRPSSRANIIETLKKRGFMEKKGKKLLSTLKGKQLIGIIKDDMLKSPTTTGEWEKKLRQMERGEYKRTTFMQELEQKIREITDQVKKDTDTIKSLQGSSKATKTSGKADSIVGTVCPKCGKGKIFKNKYSYSCTNWKNGCDFRKPFNEK